jgi:hypothetical protein
MTEDSKPRTLKDRLDEGCRKLKLRVVLPIFIILVTVLVFLIYPCRTPLAAILAPSWTTLLVLQAMFTDGPDEKTIAGLLPTSTTQTPDPNEPWKMLYDKATQMHIETDKGMYQIVTIFCRSVASGFKLGSGSATRSNQSGPHRHRWLSRRCTRRGRHPS